MVRLELSEFDHFGAEPDARRDRKALVGEGADRGVALTLALSIRLFAALVLVLASGHFLGLIAARLGIQPAVLKLWKIAQWPSAIVFVLIGFSLIYFFGPDLRERRWRWITPGSAFGTLLWLLVSVGFRVYLHFYNSYSHAYGSLGAVMILLAWLYIGGLALLIGGEIDAQAGACDYRNRCAIRKGLGRHAKREINGKESKDCVSRPAGEHRRQKPGRAH
ncbi:MAG: YihY/virulence factor BrkB family protein [Candidatus Acidiferrales bacterium]